MLTYIRIVSGAYRYSSNVRGFHSKRRKGKESVKYCWRKNKLTRSLNPLRVCMCVRFIIQLYYTQAFVFVVVVVVVVVVIGCSNRSRMPLILSTFLSAKRNLNWRLPLCQRWRQRRRPRRGEEEDHLVLCAAGQHMSGKFPIIRYLAPSKSSSRESVLLLLLLLLLLLPVVCILSFLQRTASERVANNEDSLYLRLSRFLMK